MIPYPSPCDSCPVDQYTCTGCDEWKKRYHIRQRQINAYARRVRQETVAVRYQYPHPDEYRYWLRFGPCQGCPAEEHCDIPCAAYLQWWDERMGWFRRMLE